MGVVFLHLQEHLPQLNLAETVPITGKLFLLVDFFFLLSGIVLAHVYGQRFANRIKANDCADFFMARIARCWPMILLGAILAFTANRLLVGADLRTTPLDVAAAGLLIEALGMSAWFDWVWLNPPSWSLTAEFMLYLAAPWLIWAIARLPMRALWAGLLILPLIPSFAFPLAAKIVAQPDGITAIFGQSIAYFGPEAPWFWFVKGPFVLTRAIPMFIIGLILHRLWQNNEIERWATPTNFAFFALATLLAMNAELPRAVILVGFVAVALTALGDRTRNMKFLAKPTWNWLGNLSLAIYLLHFPIVDIFEALWSFATDSAMRQASPLSAWVILIGLMTLIVLISDLLHNRFEGPARQLLRRWWQNRRQVSNRDVTIEAPGRLLFVSIMLASLAMPVAMLGQGWIIQTGQTRLRPFVERVESEPNKNQLEAKVRLAGEGGLQTPIKVRGLGDWIAEIGPNRRNGGVFVPGSTVNVSLWSLKPQPGPANLELRSRDKVWTIALDEFVVNKPHE